MGTTLAIGQNQPPRAPGRQGRAAPRAVRAAPSGAADRGRRGELSASQRKEIEAIIKDYLLNNPEVLLEMQNALEAKMDKIQAERTAAAIKEQRQGDLPPRLLARGRQRQGRRDRRRVLRLQLRLLQARLHDVAKLVDKDKQVKFILKELPILSKGSEEAAKVALAAKMQGKYWEFHRAMLESQGQANEASALRVAEKVGLDMARLKKDMASPEVKKEIDETRALAPKLGIQGTPHFLVGDRIIPGAPENLLEQMSKLVAEVRKEGCKVC